MMGGAHASAAQAGASAAAACTCSSTTALTAAPDHSSAIVASGRRLKILEHHVHKVEERAKENGDKEEELVVSNLRPFTLKVRGRGPPPAVWR